MIIYSYMYETMAANTDVVWVIRSHMFNSLYFPLLPTLICTVGSISVDK